jgi:hypothetical protein
MEKEKIMKASNEKKICKVIFTLNLFLAIILCFSFIDFSGKEKGRNSAILNPSYKDKTVKIIIDCPQNIEISVDKKVILHKKIELERKGKSWFGQIKYSGLLNEKNENSSSTKNLLENYRDDSYFPVNASLVNNLLESVTKIIKMYKKSYNKKYFKDLNLDSQSGVSLIFFDSDNKELSSLIFGKSDSLKQEILLRSLKNDTVYSVNDEIKTYLNNDENFWCEQNIFPSALTDDKFYDSYRRGSVIYTGQKINADKNRNQFFTKDFGNASEVKLNIIPLLQVDESIKNYMIIPEFTPGFALSAEESFAWLKVNYSYTISQWTYNKLAENFKF